MNDKEIIDAFIKVTEPSGAWSDDTRQLNIGASPGNPTLQAFKALAWLLRETHSGLLDRLVSEEVVFLATKTNIFDREGANEIERKVRSKVKKRPDSDMVPDAIADAVSTEMKA